MNIYIKAFNRPFCLDRCLRSVEKHVIGDKHIVVLDDGTLPSYLDKITKLHPHIEMRSSNEGKSGKYQLLREKKFAEIAGSFVNPMLFWRSEIAKGAGDYFMLLEEDTWFIQDLNTDVAYKEIAHNNAQLLKLWWCNSFIPPDSFSATNGLSFYKRPPVSNVWSHWHVWLQAMAIYKTSYWDWCTDGVDSMVDEWLPLLRAQAFLDKNPHAVFANTDSRALQHSWSIPGRSDSKYYDIGVEQHLFQDAFNDAWFSGELDSLAGYPDDFPASELYGIAQRSVEEPGLTNWGHWHTNQRCCGG